MKIDLSEKEMAGMTVNERLYLSGLLEDYDDAVKKKDESKLRIILEKIYLTQENIQVIIKQKLK